MYKQLTSEQRYTISAILRQKKSKKEIAETIQVHISTVYREITRNKGKYLYSFKSAQDKCASRKHRMRKMRSFDLPMREKIKQLIISEQWSPKQICGYFKGLSESCVSHETIYSYIRFDRQCGGELWTHTRHRLKYFRRVNRVKHYPIKGRISIDQRPEQANGKRFGDWEMDTIIGKEGKGAILTLVERSTNFTIIAKLPKGKNARPLVDVAYRLLLPYKSKLLTITTDNGSEFAQHKLLSEKLQTTIYFAHPYSSWEKGAIENTNKLIRQYIPKSVCFSQFSDEQIKLIQYKLNRRPREKLNFKTPKECFFNNYY